MAGGGGGSDADMLASSRAGRAIAMDSAAAGGGGGGGGGRAGLGGDYAFSLAARGVLWANRHVPPPPNHHLHHHHTRTREQWRWPRRSEQGARSAAALSLIPFPPFFIPSSTASPAPSPLALGGCVASEAGLELETLRCFR